MPCGEQEETVTNSDVTELASSEPEYWEDNNPVLLETLAAACEIPPTEAAGYLATTSEDLKVLDGDGPILATFVNDFIIEVEHADVRS